MHWRIVGKNKVIQRAIVAGFFGLLIVCGISNTTIAVDSEIGATVCGNGSVGAGIQITQPIDDSVVNQTPTTFRGSITDTSQLVVEIDGDYVSTVAIGNNQTTFSIDLSLSAGTHTVTITANGICGGSDADDSIILTYQPAVEPSNGGTTPTEVEGVPTVTPAGEAIDTSGDEASFLQQLERLPIIGPAISSVSDFATAIGLDATVTNGNSSTAVGVIRVGITIIALTVVVMASILAPLVAQALPGVSGVFSTGSHRSMIYLGWAIRGVGILAMALVYFL